MSTHLVGTRRTAEKPAVTTTVTAVGLLGLSVALIALAVFKVDSPIRLLVTLAFALTAPGWALVAYLRDRTPAMEWTIATCASIAIVIIASMTMLVLHAWHPVGAMCSLAVVTGGVLVHHIVRAGAVERPDPENRP